MGFIKHAFIGIVLYEAFKKLARVKHLNEGNHPAEVILGGKVYHREELGSKTSVSHRHHLDRPDLGSQVD